jgi:hypothetical protein
MRLRKRKRENFKVADEIVSYDQLILCSNRAGLHYAYNLRIAPEGDYSDRLKEFWEKHASNMEAAIARLKRAGWKESKGN